MAQVEHCKILSDILFLMLKDPCMSVLEEVTRDGEMGKACSFVVDAHDHFRVLVCPVPWGGTWK